MKSIRQFNRWQSILIDVNRWSIDAQSMVNRWERNFFQADWHRLISIEHRLTSIDIDWQRLISINIDFHIDLWGGIRLIMPVRAWSRRLSKVVVGRGGALRESSSEGTSWEPLFHVFGPQFIFIWSLKYSSADLRESWVHRPSRVVGPPTQIFLP